MPAKLYHRSEIDPEEWDAFIQASPQGSVYALYGYANIIFPDWQAIILEKGGKWQAVMPLALSKKWRFTTCLQPPFAQYWGICFRASGKKEKTYDILSNQRKWTMEIIETLPKLELFVQHFSPHNQYSLPFHWHKYQLISRYTYHLDLTQDEALLMSGQASSRRQQIRRADQMGFSIKAVKEADSLLTLIRKNEEQGNMIFGGQEQMYATLKSLSAWLIQNGIGRIWVAEKEDGTALAAALFVRFRTQGVYLAGAYLPEERNSSAMSWLLWKIILQLKSENCTIFDFEGSMIEGIEGFYRKFGAYPVPYLQIRRNLLPLIIKWIKGYTY